MARQKIREILCPLAEQRLEKVAREMACAGSHGLEATVGLTVSDDMEASINNTMIHRAPQSYVVCGSSTLGHSGRVSLTTSSFIALIADPGNATETQGTC